MPSFERLSNKEKVTLGLDCTGIGPRNAEAECNGDKPSKLPKPFLRYVLGERGPSCLKEELFIIKLNLPHSLVELRFRQSILTWPIRYYSLLVHPSHCIC